MAGRIYCIAFFLIIINWISCKAPEATPQQKLTFLSFLSAGINGLDHLLTDFTDQLSSAMYDVENKQDVVNPKVADSLKNKSRYIVMYLKERLGIIDTLVDADGSFELKDRCKKYFEHTIAVIKNETTILTHYLRSGGRSTSYDEAHENLSIMNNLVEESQSIHEDLRKFQIRNRISNDELTESEQHY